MALSERRKATARTRAKAYRAAGRCPCGREPENGLTRCAPCAEASRKSQRKRYAKKREQLCAESRDWRARNLDRARAAGRAKWQATKADPDKLAVSRTAHRERAYKRQFGLTAEQVREMHDAQSEACDICKRPFSDCGGRGSRGIGHVDHCHRTGRVRALLCARCNLSIGHLEAWDEQGILMSMCAYILRHRGTGQD